MPIAPNSNTYSVKKHLIINIWRITLLFEMVSIELFIEEQKILSLLIVIKSKNSQISSLTGELAKGVQSSISTHNHQEMQKVHEELKNLYKKLAEKDQTIIGLSNKIEEYKTSQSDNKELFKHTEEKLQQEQHKNEITRYTLNEVVDKLDRVTNQYNVTLRGNNKLQDDVKSLQADNALLFKKIVSLQEEVVQQYNTSNEVESDFQVIEEKEEDKYEGEYKAKRTMSCVDQLKESFDMQVQKMPSAPSEDFKFDFSFAIPSRPTYKKVSDDWETTALVYNFRGTTLATGSVKGALRLWDPLHGGEVRSLKNFESAICTLTFSTDNQNLIAWYVDNSIRVWRTNSMKLVNT